MSREERYQEIIGEILSNYPKHCNPSDTFLIVKVVLSFRVMVKMIMKGLKRGIMNV